MFKKSVLYSILFSFLLNQGFSSSLWADGAPDFSRALTQSEPQKFNLISPQLKEALEEVAHKSTGDHAQETQSFGLRWGISGARALIISLVIISIDEVRRKLHERNLEPDKVSVTQVSSEIAHDLVGTPQLFFKTTDALLMFAPSTAVNLGASQIARGLSWGAGRAAATLNSNFFKIVQSELGGEVMANVFTSLLAGGFLSFGINSAADMITYASRFVIEHPEVFGNCSQEEIAALVKLQTQFGISAFFGGYLYGYAKDKSPTYTAYQKVFQALNFILFHNPILRDNIASHVWREVVVDGRDWAVLAYGAASVGTSTYILYERTLKGLPNGVLRSNLTGLGVSLVVGTAAALVPENWYDSATYYLRTKMANHYHYSDSSEGTFFDYQIKPLPDSPVGLRQLENILSTRRENRHIRMGYYISLMKLSLDRIDVLSREREEVRKLAAEKSNTPMTLRQKSWDAFLRFLGGDGGSPETRLQGYDKLIEKYRSFFNQAAYDFSTEYDHDRQWFEQFAKILPLGLKQSRLQYESKNLAIVSGFIKYFSSILTAGSPLLTTDTTANNEYRAARRKLDQYSFWGLNESFVIETASK